MTEGKCPLCKKTIDYVIYRGPVDYVEEVVTAEVDNSTGKVELVYSEQEVVYDSFSSNHEYRCPECMMRISEFDEHIHELFEEGV